MAVQMDLVICIYHKPALIRCMRLGHDLLKIAGFATRSPRHQATNRGLAGQSIYF